MTVMPIAMDFNVGFIATHGEMGMFLFWTIIIRNYSVVTRTSKELYKDCFVFRCKYQYPLLFRD